MGFKTNREFLRNISVGAVGTRQILRLLNGRGFRLIDIDRSALSSKLWATKVKRLRVPDLLCLKSGVRIESRAKGELGIIMSHSPTDPERAWDTGLRDHDLVAYIRCFPLGEARWKPSPYVALFQVGDLRATLGYTRESQRKAASEGSEKTLRWPAIVPKSPGRVEEIKTDVIVTRLDTGRKQPYSLSRTVRGTTLRLNPHVSEGDRFGEGDRIIASIVPSMVPPVCVAGAGRAYDFVSELGSDDRATVFGAVKALGFLPKQRDHSVHRLSGIMANHSDRLIRLEAAGALARLEVPDGWEFLQRAVQSGGDQAYRMEAILLLSDLRGEQSLSILRKVIGDRGNPSELRSAAVWGMGSGAYEIEQTNLLESIVDQDEDTALHAIVSLSRLTTDRNVDVLLDRLGSDQRLSAALVKVVQLSKVRPLKRIIGALKSESGDRRNWLLYLLAGFGPETCEEVLKSEAPELLPELEFFWRYHAQNWMNRFEVADRLDFLLAQDQPESA